MAARKTAAQRRLDSLKSERDELLLRAEVAELAQFVEGTELQRQWVMEAWGDTVDRREYLTDDPSFAIGEHLSLPSDREHGDNPPLWQTETEHAEIRGICRHLYQLDETAIAAIDGLTNYVVGDGFFYEVEPAEGFEHLVTPERLAQLNGLVRRYLKSVGWDGLLERELFVRLIRDGEIFLDVRNGVTVLEPEWVMEPASPRTVEDFYDLPSWDWKYGIASDTNEPTNVHGIFVQRFGDPNDWEFIPKGDFFHAKLNVDRRVKRGMSDLYAVWKTLNRAGKLLENTMLGAAIQASIAFIREHAPTMTSDQITSFRNSQREGTYTRTTAGGTQRTVSTQRFRPGTVVDTNGSKYQAGPMGTPQGPTYLEIVQGALRRIGTRFSMPEYLISGDASNANYASTLVAESPFTKACQARQYLLTRFYKSVVERRLASTPEADLIEVAVTAPEIVVRNKVEDHTVRREEHEAGILSARTWAEESGRDYDREVERGAGPKAAPVVPAPAATPQDRLQEAARILWRDYP